LGVKRVMVLHSPAIVINQAEAASTLDAEIAQLLSAEKSAADRSDYEAAAGYKQNREARSLDRAKTIADAWKTMPQDQQNASIKKLIGPFVNILNPDGRSGIAVRITRHQDHYDRENWLTMIQSIASAWPKELSPGSFAVGWPSQFADSSPTVSDLISVTKSIVQDLSVPSPSSVAAPPKAKKPVPTAPATPVDRRTELLGMRHFALKSAADKVGVVVTGKVKPAIVEEILAKEQQPVAA
jgi:hypothetical protein